MISETKDSQLFIMISIQTSSEWKNNIIAKHITNEHTMNTFTSESCSINSYNMAI